MPAKASLPTTFGQHLRHFRLLRGLTQSQLSASAAVHRVTIANLENDARYPTLLTAARLARALDCTVDDLHAGPGILAQNVLHLRLTRQWSVTDLSAKSGMEHSEIEAIESGTNVASVRPLVRVFGVSATDLRAKPVFRQIPH